ncbi:MAG: glycine--tRNA ligase subunit beta [Cyanobacteria bacterium P01_H01_bin.130]
MPAFLFEVGTEELPASFVAQAIAQWKTLIPESLKEANLAVESIQYFGTPRRLAVLIEGLPERQPDKDEEIKGPPAKAAFRDGEPTNAAIGFAKKYGATPDALEVRPTEKGDFVFLKHFVAGRTTAELLQELAPQWVLDLEGKRFMRWRDGELRFPRPIRWLVALLEDQVVPVSLTVRAAADGCEELTVMSDRHSQGHRVLHPEPISFSTATNYGEGLRAASVLVSPQEREELIVEQIKAAEAELGATIDIDGDLLAEVRDLTEFPTAVIGKFDDEFLELPPEVIITVMVTHQRYFAVAEKDNSAKLLPNFVAISNGDPAKSDIIAAGNGRVIRARLNDGQFFYDADLKQSLETYLAELEKVTFQDKLGSMAKKVDRMVALAELLCDRLNITGDNKTIALRAVKLAKADLVTQMVKEFPELQGIMGEKYARTGDEGEAVAIAIGEHYLPKGAGDVLPQSEAGRIAALSDRLDTLTALFGIGIIPSGSSDPFALRRAANAIVNILWDAAYNLDLAELTEAAIGDAPENGDAVDQVKNFFGQRFQTLLQEEQNIDYDLVNSVLGDLEGDRDSLQRALQNPLDTLVRAQFLQTLRGDGRLQEIYATINRAAKLAKKGDLAGDVLDPSTCVDPAKFEQPSENALCDRLQSLAPMVQDARASQNYDKVVEALQSLAPIVTDFFDGEHSVMVMADDPAIQKNRLNLLGLLRNQANILGDFSLIVKG